MNLRQRHIEMCPAEGEDIVLKQCIRINTLKIDPQNCIQRLKKQKVRLEKVSYLENAYFAEADFSLASMPEYLHGYFYIQESASQVPALVLNPQKDDSVIDMCASPGSKTTQIAQLMQNKGRIIALDLNPRIEKLTNNLQRLGIKNCIIYNRDARFFDFNADKILLDAPCSGNYAVDKDWFNKRTMNDIMNCARVQKELISAAIKNLNKNGILVYSTCSLEPEENEDVIEWALGRLDVKLEKINFPIGDQGFTKNKNAELSKTLRLWPSKTGTQGFFIAKLVKGRIGNVTI